MKRREFLGLIGLTGCADIIIKPEVKTATLFYNAFVGGYHPTYQAYLDRNTALGNELPLSSVRGAQNALVQGLDNAGLLSRAKRFLFLHSGSNATCLVDLIDPINNTSTMPVEYDFSEGWGVKSGRRNGYIRQGFKSNQYSGIETDLTLVQLIPDMPQVDTIPLVSLSHGMGTVSAANRAFGLYPFYNSSNIGYKYHSSTSVSFASTSHGGLHVTTYDGTNLVHYKDGTRDSTSSTPTTPDIGIDRGILTFNSATVTNGFTAATFYDRFISIDALFDRFSDSDESTLRGLLNTYVSSLSLGSTSMTAPQTIGANDTSVILTKASHCWFTREKGLYNNTANKTWVCQVHDDGTGYTQWVVEIDHSSGAVTKTKIGTVTQFDDHNEASILVKQDGKLFVAYCEHAVFSSPIRYRTSTNVRDSTSWGSESTIIPTPSDGYTYCNAFQVTNGDIYIFYRETDAINDDWAYIKSTDNGVTFGSKVLFTSKTYCNIRQDPNDADIIHIIASEHPNQLVAPNKVIHFYFDAGAGTWHKTDGTTITPVIDNTNGQEILATTGNEQGWVEDVIVDSSGYPRALLSYYPDASGSNIIDKRLYYTEWNGSAWSTPTQVHQSANRNMGVASLVNSYAPLACFNQSNPDVFFACKDVSGPVSELFAVTRLTATTFNSVQLTSGSDYDNWRPFSTKAPNRNLFWLSKIYYGDYKGISASDLGYYQELMNVTY